MKDATSDKNTEEEKTITQQIRKYTTSSQPKTDKTQTIHKKYG